MNVNSPLLHERTDVQHQQRLMAHSVKEIAEAFSFPISGVHDMLTGEVKQLEKGAKIRQYVLLLSIKLVKDMLAANRRIGS